MNELDITELLNEIDSTASDSGIHIDRGFARDLILEYTESDIESLAVFIIDSTS